MKNITIILAIIMTLSLMIIINANETKYRPTNLFHERFLDLLMKEKQRELLNKYKQRKNYFHRRANNEYNHYSNEDDYSRIFLRRKVVGISDNPF